MMKKSKLLPIAIASIATLACGLVATGLITYNLNTHNQQAIVDAVTETAQRIQGDILKRIELYQYGLRGARGAILTAGEQQVTRKQFTQYSNTRDTDREFPGARGFGFIRRVPAAEEARFVAQARADGWPDFSVQQLTPHDGERYIIQYIEPITRNAKAVGLDIASEVNRRTAADAAIDSGEARLSGPITLVQTTGKPLQSFLLLMPIYRTGLTPATETERRAQAFGWSYAPLLMEEVLAGIPINDTKVHITLTDIAHKGGAQEYREVFYHSSTAVSPNLYTQHLYSTIFGRRWEMELSVYPRYIQQLNLQTTHSVLLFGTLISILLASLVATLLLTRQRKQQIIAAQAHMAAIVETSVDAIISKTLDGIVTSWNHGAEEILGYSAADAIGKPLAELIVPEDLLFEEEDILRRIKHNQAVPPFSTLRQRPDGKLIPVSVSVSPILDADGRVIGASKTLRNISEQQQLENDLLKLNQTLEHQVNTRTHDLDVARRNLQTVLDAMPSVIGYWDKNLINRVANRAYQTWFDIDASKIPGMHMDELLNPQYRAEHHEKVAAALRGEAQTFECDLPIPHSTEMRHALTHYLPEINNGDVEGFYVIVHDITEVTKSKRQLAAALRENKALLRSINEHMLYTITDVKGRILDANDNFCLTSGYKKEELIGKSHKLLSSQFHPQSFWQDLWQQISTLQTWRGEICNRSKNGDLRWFDTVIAPLLDTQGNVERYLALRIDITERKTTEAERTQFNRLLTNLLDAASEQSIITTDCDGLITVFNRGAEKMLGYSAAEMVGKSSPAPLHLPAEVGARAEALSHEYQTSIEGFDIFTFKARTEGPETRDWTYIRKDGSQLTVSLAVTAMRDEQGGITGYLGIATDITAELEQQRLLEHTRDQLETAAGVAELGIWTWNLEDDSLEWNERMFAIYNQPIQLLANNELNYKHWQERVHPEDLARTEAMLKGAIENREIYNLVFRVLLPTGQVRFVQAGAVVEHNAQGRAIRVTGINQDITDQHLLEDSLRHAKDEADAASAAKSAFLANISHEIRTPMNAVLGMLQLVQQTQLNSRQQDYLGKAHSAAKSLLSLLNDLLDFSKIDAGKLQLDPHPFDLELLLRDLAVILTGNHEAKAVEVIFDVNSQLPRMLIGDRLRLQQILINLTGNALKFTPAGQVILHLDRVQQSAQELQLKIAVIDTGIGISQEQQARIFDGFTQAEASTTRRFGGTGLGLAISRRLIELMGGTLQLTSRLGKGSRFEFDITLPIMSDIPLLDTSSVTQQRRKVLVVDDNQLVRELTAKTLENVGWEVLQAENGRDAIALTLEANRLNQGFDAILMDWRMPDLDGLTAAEMIRGHKDLTHPPVVIMVTAYGREILAERQEQGEVPFAELLTKPLTPQLLTETLVAAISGERKEVINPRHELTLLSNLRLLVVEDNAINRQVAAELLGNAGALVDLAEGGIEGVAKVMSNPNAYDLVIMDIQMPDIDGFEATRRIRADARFKQLPILAMTANASASDRRDCLQAGMNEHIGKPIDMDELVPHILKLCGRFDTTTQNTRLVISPLAPETVAKVAQATAQETSDAKDNPSTPLVEPYSNLLKRFGNNQSLYLRSLAQFPLEAQKLIDQIRTQAEKQNLEATCIAAHSLKGVASTLGASRLAAVAATLEKALKNAEQAQLTELVTPELLTQLEELLTNSNALLNEQVQQPNSAQTTASAAPATALSAAEWQMQKQAIQALLKEDNLAVLDQVEALCRQPTAHQDLLNTLLEQVNALDFGAALSTLAQLPDEL